MSMPSGSDGDRAICPRSMSMPSMSMPSGSDGDRAICPRSMSMPCMSMPSGSDGDRAICPRSMSMLSGSDGDRAIGSSHAVLEEDAVNAAQSSTEALKKRARTFSYSVAVPLWSLLVAIFVQHHLLFNSKPTGLPLEIALLQTCVLSTVVTSAFVGAFLLVAEFLPDDDDPNRYHYLALKLLLHACGFLLKLTAFCLLLLIDAAGNAVMATVVLLAAALHVVLYNKTRRSNYHSDAVGYAPYAEELDRLIDFSKEMVSVAYGGLVGRVFDYFKNFTTDVRRAHMKVFDVLMFFTAVVAALALTFDVLPPLLQEERDRTRLMRVLEWLNIASAVTAVAAALSLSFVVVGEYAFLAVVPPLALAVWWLHMYFANEGPRRRTETGGRGAQAGQGSPVPVAVPVMGFGVLFAVILNSNSTPITVGVVDLVEISIYVFSVVFIMGLGWRLLEHRTPRDPNLARAVRYMSRCNHTTMMVATVLLGALVSKTMWNFARDGNGASADSKFPTRP